MMMGCTGMHWAVLGCTGLYWAELGCTGLYLAELSYTGQGRWSNGPGGQDDQPR